MSPTAAIQNIRPYPYVAAIIQARLDSLRFPRKMLADLNGKPVLARVIERVKKAETVNAVVVATPDKELRDLAQECGAWGYQEPNQPDNVLRRYIEAAHWCGAQIVVRITGDCPILDPKIIDISVNTYKNERVDLVSNVIWRSFPRGYEVEVTHANVLKRIYHLTDDARDREHVTLFAYKNPALFRMKNIEDTEDNSYLRACVDYLEDLDKIKDLCISVNVDDYHSVIKMLRRM
jgi:spore coat polysaccharide biosynthesis protein SpsF